MCRWVTPQLELSRTRTDPMVTHGTTRLPLWQVYSRFSHGSSGVAATSLTSDGQNHGVPG